MGQKPPPDRWGLYASASQRKTLAQSRPEAGGPPRTGSHEFGRANAAVSASLEQPQQLDLHAERNLAHYRPDLILLGLAMKGGRELLSELKADDPARRVVVTAAEAIATPIEAIRAGANACLSAAIEPEALLSQVKLAIRGETVVCDSLAAALASALREDPGDEASMRRGLAGCEREVLRGVAAGMSNKMIADEFAISVGTVNLHIKHILKKLGFRSRLAAVWAVKRGGAG